MELDRKELKAQAREDLDLARPRGWAVTLVYILMTTGVSLALSLVPLPTSWEGGLFSTSIFLSILLALYTAVVNFGYTLWSLWTRRRLEPGMSALTQGFTVAGRVILMEVFIALRLFCWLFLLTLLASFLVLTLFPIWLMGSGLSVLLFYLLLIGAMLVIMLRYALAPYLLADHPDDGPSLAIHRSVDLMGGWKMELFKLELSFLGWVLLIAGLDLLVELAALWYFGFFQLDLPLSVDGLLTLQSAFTSITNHPLTILASTLVTLLPTLWYTPYRAVTLAGFYDARLRAPQPDDQPMMPPL